MTCHAMPCHVHMHVYIVISWHMDIRCNAECMCVLACRRFLLLLQKRNSDNPEKPKYNYLGIEIRKAVSGHDWPWGVSHMCCCRMCVYVCQHAPVYLSACGFVPNVRLLHIDISRMGLRPEQLVDQQRWYMARSGCSCAASCKLCINALMRYTSGNAAIHAIYLARLDLVDKDIPLLLMTSWFYGLPTGKKQGILCVCLQMVERANEWATRLGVKDQAHYIYSNATISLDSILSTYPGRVDQVRETSNDLIPVNNVWFDCASWRVHHLTGDAVLISKAWLILELHQSININQPTFLPSTVWCRFTFSSQIPTSRSATTSVASSSPCWWILSRRCCHLEVRSEIQDPRCQR